MRMRDLLETACRVEARSQLVGERLIVDEVVRVRRANGLPEEAHGVKVAAFNPGDLRAQQRGAVLEILRATLRPFFELSVVGGQSLEMLPVLVGERGIAAGRARKPTIEVILCCFKK